MLALGRLGQTLTITDLDTENTNHAKVIRRHFRMSLDTILEKHDWNFATKFEALTLQSEDPIVGYRYCYTLPSDLLVIRQIAEEGIFNPNKQYEHEKAKFRLVYNGAGQRIIYTNVQNAHAEYTVRLPESSAFPNHFGRAFAAQLSMDIAPQLITNNYSKVSESINTLAMNDINNGIAFDLGQQPLPEDPASPFQSVRW